MTHNASSKLQDLRKQAEQILNEVSKENKLQSSEFSMNIDELFHELEVHQIELEMQHSELQIAYGRLEENRQAYIDLFDFAPIGYLITDHNGVILNFNLTLMNMFGLNRAQIEGRRLAKFISRSYIDAYYLSRKSLFATSQPQTCVVSLQLPHDRGFFARLDCTLIEGKEQCRIALTDISQQRKAEQTTKLALERERELHQLKSQLLEMITHEFRTPLTIILSSVDLLERYSKMPDMDNKSDRQRKKILDYAWHMTRMVNEIAIAYQTETERIKIKQTQFDSQEMLQELVEDLNQVNQNRLNVAVEKAPDTDFTIEFDQALLRQILMNLIGNGLKFSEDMVLVTLTMFSEDFHIVVSDTGIGIPEDAQTQIFDSFFRADNARAIPGTGLGLSIAKHLVEACRGTIDVSSKLGAETTVTLTFPRHLVVV